ncbi:MAG: hypothetical protein H7Z73_03465 [Candidatus Saccharibacteria bacterium]|nr:hypothetical protein [Moraxellaceae bacterium]
MNKANTKKLYESFPFLYGDHDKPMTQTLMCWGFEYGDGWFDLIFNLSKAIEQEAEKSGLTRSSDLWPRAEQVKEKFGTLRFYVANGSKPIYDLIAKAEAKSEHTCEECGLPGKTREGGWVHTTCQVCEELRNNKRG